MQETMKPRSLTLAPKKDLNRREPASLACIIFAIDADIPLSLSLACAPALVLSLASSRRACRPVFCASPRRREQHRVCVVYIRVCVCGLQPYMYNPGVVFIEEFRNCAAGGDDWSVDMYFVPAERSGSVRVWLSLIAERSWWKNKRKRDLIRAPWSRRAKVMAGCWDYC